MTAFETGQELGRTQIELTRADLVRYAGASGDFNPIHWNDRFATEVGLPGVIAHGMLTMGAAVQLVTDWAGCPGRIEDYQTRFTGMVPVADGAGTNPAEAVGATLDVVATVGKVVDEDRIRVDLEVTLDGEKVLNRAQAIVNVSGRSEAA
ncbi:MaoC family dehydratase [Pseudoglutamicibacter albus]|uniref:Acyl dehydratase n=1 Tax=Pseudoglutamicibacter albus TaxID=98671 RepID=A0ABU1Z0J0_9MICC|nr:MaoC family dehydratase [Pseudoglutamicibacter albus]MDR7294129.1 acyl dehydratase [Pseudoglutamicibacter albus]